MIRILEEQMSLMKILRFLSFVTALLVSHTALAGILWQATFDSLPDWESQEQITTSTVDGTISWDLTVPEPFSDYRSARGSLSTLGEHTFQINSKHRYGQIGKGLSCFYESANTHIGGGLGIWLGETGYDELYVGWWMLMQDNWRFATVGGLGGTIFKLFRVMSNIDNPDLKPKAAEPMNMYPTPWNRKPEWDLNTNPLNAQGEGGKQGYVILRWEQVMGEIVADKVAYNPEGRAGSLNDIYKNFDNSARVYWRDFHGRKIETGALPTASYAPADWVGNGKWVRYEIHVKHNTVGQDNGLFEFFLDGKKVGQVSGLHTRNTEKTKFNYIIIPDNIHNLIYANTTPPPPPEGEQAFAIDNIVVSTSYIGMPASGESTKQFYLNTPVFPLGN